VLMAFDLLHQDGHELEASLYEAGPTRRWLKVKQKAWTGRGGPLAASDPER